MESQTSHNQGIHILESALDHAFAAPLQPISTPPAVASSKSKSSEDQHVSTAEPVEGSTASNATSSLEDTWKAEYEAQVQSWRAQSAEAREKAEKERLRWESIRAIEKEEAAKRKAAGIIDDPPEFIVHPVGESSDTASTNTMSSNAASETDSGLLTASSTQVGPVAEGTVSRQDTTMEESQKWEDVPSVTSSFPSMSFPEHVETSPDERRVAVPQPAPVSLTSAIFDSSLSRRTRLTAFFSSLAVNLLLPFVNGVMLGFGEIFAKNVVMGWLGWHLKPGSVAAAVGIRGSSREQRQHMFSR